MKYTYKKWWFQPLLWSGIFLFFFMLLSQFKDIKVSLFAASYSTLAMLLMQILSRRKLIPLHKNGRPYATLISIASLIITASLLGAGEYLALKFLIFDIPDHRHPPLIVFSIRQCFTFGFIFFVNYAISLQEQTTELKVTQKRLHEEKLETELKLLKAQINPHFMFNALNNIYSLTYMQSEKAPESVLKLSEMLRYVFYDCSKDKVAINSEIKYIENFTAFQQMKSDYEQNITMNVKLHNSLIDVAPMLFIPFIENAFKYSRIEEDESAYVSIDISQEQESIKIDITNSIPHNNKPLAGSGMGIDNVRHRLDIIYPDAYTLEMVDDKQTFKVNLELKL